MPFEKRYEVFLSCGHGDRALVHELRDKLEDQGFSVFLELAESSREAGKPFLPLRLDRWELRGSLGAFAQELG